MRARIAVAFLASLVCIVSWCSITMPTEAEIDRQIYCHNNPTECAS